MTLAPRDTDHDNSATVLMRLQDLFANFSLETVAQLHGVYAADIEFIDPIHRVQGLPKLERYLAKMARNLAHYQLRYTDLLAGDGQACLRWEMDFAHPRIKAGQIITISGMTHLRFHDKIYRHEDCYDLGSMLYEHLPVLGAVIKLIKKHMARQD